MSLIGEYHFARAYRQQEIGSAISDMRQARRWFPLYHAFREDSAQVLGALALQHDQEPHLKEVALAELFAALRDDPTAADLLVPAISLELALNRDADAKALYAQFKRVAKSSPLNQIVEKSDDREYPGYYCGQHDCTIRAKPGINEINPIDHEQTK